MPLAYNGAQTTMVVSVDRVSHANGWSFHSDLPGLTRRDPGRKR